MNRPRLFMLILWVLLSGPAAGIMMDVEAITTDGWSCDSPGAARMNFVGRVTITGASPAWSGELIDWGVFPYKDCNLGILGLLQSVSGVITIAGPSAVGGASINVTLPCPAQGRTLAIATNRGYGPGILAKEDTSFCPQPCAPILCQPDFCDTVH